jgi:hypothetical protein
MLKNANTMITVYLILIQVVRALYHPTVGLMIKTKYLKDAVQRTSNPNGLLILVSKTYMEVLQTD